MGCSRLWRGALWHVSSVVDGSYVECMTCPYPFPSIFFSFFFSSRRRHTRLQGDWSSDVCSSDLSHYYSGRMRRCAPGWPIWHREEEDFIDRKSTRLNSSHLVISYAVFCLKKK